MPPKLAIPAGSGKIKTKCSVIEQYTTIYKKNKGVRVIYTIIFPVCFKNLFKISFIIRNLGAFRGREAPTTIQYLSESDCLQAHLRRKTPQTGLSGTPLSLRPRLRRGCSASLQSLAPRSGSAKSLHDFAISQDAWTSSEFANANSRPASLARLGILKILNRL
jgi:hypothetical protein